MSWIVMIEWDGKKPSTRYYQRMKAIGLCTGKGDSKTQSPMERRALLNVRAAGGGDSVIFQEGCVVCEGESVARFVYRYALDDGARAVQLLNADPVEWMLTAEDERVMQRIEGALGKRGRPSTDQPKQDWVVTCYEKAESLIMVDSYHATHCPKCSSLKVRARAGKPESFAVPSGDVFDAWKRHRFAFGMFEIPVTDKLAPQPPPVAACDDDAEAKTVRMIESNKDLRQRLAGMNRETALAVLDAIFCARTYVGDEARKKKRIDAVVYLYEHGVKPTEIGLLEQKDTIEFVDAAGVIPPDKVAAMYIATKTKERK